MNRIIEEWLLAKVRDFNSDIHKVLWKSERLPLGLLNHYTKVIADELYKEQPHWHQYKGPCMKVTPFEINMQALALLASIWVADIYLRKARDRKAPGMESRYNNWRKFMESAMEFTKKEIEGTRDLDAEKAWERDRGKPGRIKCFINRLLWGH